MRIPAKTSHFIPALIIAGLLLGIASLPGNDLHEVQTGPDSSLLRFLLSDPFMHFLTFALLTFLVGSGYYLSRGGKIPLGRVVLLAIGYGLFIEVYQWILPWRGFGLDDLLWNTVGILFALGLLWGLQQYYSMNLRKPQTNPD